MLRFGAQVGEGKIEGLTGEEFRGVCIDALGRPGVSVVGDCHDLIAVAAVAEGRDDRSDKGF